MHDHIDRLPFGTVPLVSRTRPRAVLRLELQRLEAMVQSTGIAQRYDLLPTMSKYLDPQLVFALTEFISTRDIYDSKEVLAAQVKVLWNTNMVEFTMELYKELHGPDSTPPQELEERKASVIERITQLQDNAQKMIDVISNQTNVQGLRSDRTMNSAYLKEQFGIGPEQVDTLYEYAKSVYEGGNYKAAGELLHQYTTYSLDPLKLLSAMWGKLASEILDCNYIAATDTISKLREAIDLHLYSNALAQLQQRTWLLHWALFIHWNVDDGCTQLLDLFMHDMFTVAMQVNSPHLLRYVVAALLVSKPDAEDPRDKWRSRCNAVKRIINSEEHQYSDPLTDFAKAVFIDFDFDRAQEQLQACQEIIANDYFLAEVNEKFTEKARMAIFEVYCRIHQRINLDALATQVGMTRAETEVWIAQLIRSARLDARIDGSAGIIVMGQQSVDPLDRIIERTNNLSMRTFKIANTIVDAMKPAAAAT